MKTLLTVLVLINALCVVYHAYQLAHAEGPFSGMDALQVVGLLVNLAAVVINGPRVLA